MQTYPQAPYYNGRWSNGPTWIEVAAMELGVNLNDYAVGGATSGSGGSREPLNEAFYQLLENKSSSGSQAASAACKLRLCTFQDLDSESTCQAQSHIFSLLQYNAETDDHLKQRHSASVCAYIASSHRDKLV